MNTWQKRARLGVAVFGFVFAGIVYFAIGERQPVAPPEPVRRMDPKAIAETYAGILSQLSGDERPYEIRAERSQQYEDGSSRLFGVHITVRNRGGRDFAITANEADAGAEEVELRLSGDVALTASDGFELETAEATFDQNTGVARASGAVAFKKGRMSGSGVGMMYDQRNDVLRFDASSRVVTTDDADQTAYDFSAGVATLDRLQSLLTLENSVHVLRGDEVIDADRAVARLSETNEFVTYLELRGNARVSGGDTAFDSMSARDIDLDYTGDGALLERVVLAGGAAIAMAGADGAPGRAMFGESLDLRIAADGTLTRATGQTRVGLNLPAAEGASVRSIRAETFDGAGEPGRGLTSVTFTSPACAVGAARDQCVEYREEAYGEEAGRGRGSPAAADATRVARSRRLVVSLANDAVTNATFTGTVSFDEQGLTASAAEAVYAPREGTLRLNGRDARGDPHVEERQVTIDGQAIDVILGSRRMTARGDVKTALRPLTSSPAPQAQAASRMPGLLEQGRTVQINADALDYQGSGAVIYTGNAVLSQDRTATIQGDTITFDRETGDLAATGNARSSLQLDTGRSVGVAHEIRYDDERRTIAYTSAPAGPSPGRGAAPAASGQVQLNGPEGDVSAQHIEVVLATGRSHVERLDAYTGVSVTIGSRTATGARLTVHAADARYVMAAGPGVPVRIVDRSTNSCTEGRTLTFFKGTDRMTVDGNEEMRTETKSGGPCGPPPSSR